MAIIKRDVTDDRKKGKTARREEPSSEIDSSLPTDLTEPIDDLGRAVILITGEKKIGKTSLAAQFGKNLNMAFEVGYKGLRLFKKDIPDWDTARAVVRALKKDKKYSTVTIDTAEKSFKRAEEWSNKRLGIEHASEEEWGKGWAAIRTAFEKFIDDITHSGKGVIMISHSQEKEVKKRNGDTFDRVVSSMSRPAREVVEGIVDIWAYYGYDGDRRVLTIVGDDYIQAGHRFAERFRTPDGRRLRCIDMGRDEKEGYKNFLAAWNNKYEPENDADIVKDDESEDDDAPKKKKNKFKLKK